MGLAAAGLAAPAHALTASETQPAAMSSDAAARPKRARIVQPRVRVLPPERPAELDGQSADSSAAPGSAVPEVAQAMSPLRPSLDDAAAVRDISAEPATALQFAPVPPSRPEFVDGPQPGAILVVLPPERPAFATDPDPVQTGSLPEPAPAQPTTGLFGALFGPRMPAPAAAPVILRTGREGLNDRIAVHAKLNQVPEALVHRVVIRESRYNPAAVGKGGAMGLMQIKHATARAMGYGGTAAGLLDAETNLTYAVKYLAGAYRVAGGNHDRAVMNYARGYYYEAKRQGLAGASYRGGRRERLQREANAAAAMEPAPPPAPAPAPAPERTSDLR